MLIIFANRLILDDVLSGFFGAVQIDKNRIE